MELPTQQYWVGHIAVYFFLCFFIIYFPYFSLLLPYFFNSRGRLGSFTTELVENIQAFIKGADVPKFLVFSGHDTTVGPLLVRYFGFSF